MKNKQVYINLLNKALTVPEHETLCFYNIQDELIDLLNKSKSQSLYTKQLTYLYRQFDEYYSSDSFHSDDLIKEIKNTITILNTPLKELEKQKANTQRQLELEQYNKELPLKLLELLAEADNLKLKYKVIKIENKLNISLYKENTDYKRYGADIEINLPGNPNEYYEAVNYMSTIKEELKKEKRKADLIAAAKAKLTDEEKEMLGL